MSTELVNKLQDAWDDLSDTGYGICLAQGYCLLSSTAIPEPLGRPLSLEMIQATFVGLDNLTEKWIDDANNFVQRWDEQTYQAEADNLCHQLLGHATNMQAFKLGLRNSIKHLHHEQARASYELYKTNTANGLECIKQNAALLATVSHSVPYKIHLSIFGSSRYWWLDGSLCEFAKDLAQEAPDHKQCSPCDCMYRRWLISRERPRK